MPHQLPALAIALVLGLVLGCSSDPRTPEERVRAAIAEFQRAANQKDQRPALNLISRDYKDPAGRDYQDLKGLVALHFLRGDSLFIYSRTEALELQEPELVRGTVIAAMASTPISGIEALRRLRADVYRFEVEFREEDDGAWRLASAMWRPARPDEFF
jgi:ketosteroid isomerase-like protein